MESSASLYKQISFIFLSKNKERYLWVDVNDGFSLAVEISNWFSHYNFCKKDWSLETRESYIRFRFFAPLPHFSQLIYIFFLMLKFSRTWNLTLLPHFFTEQFEGFWIVRDKFPPMWRNVHFECKCKMVNSVFKEILSILSLSPTLFQHSREDGEEGNRAEEIVWIFESKILQSLHEILTKEMYNTIFF